MISAVLFISCRSRFAWDFPQYVLSCIQEPHLLSLQQICIQESVNSFFLQFRSLYCPEILWQKPEFPAD